MNLLPKLRDGLKLVLMLAAVPCLAQQTVYLVPDVPTDLGPTTYLPWQVIRYEPPLRTIEQSFPEGTPIAALYRTTDGDWLLSVAEPTSLGGTPFGTEDVIRFDGTIYSTAFNGTANGVPVGARIDSLYVDGPAWVIGFDRPLTVGALDVAPADLVRFEDGVWTKAFNASSTSPPVPPGVNVTGAGVEGTTLVLAFDVPTTLGPTTYAPGQPVAWDGSVFSYYQFDPEWPETSRLAALFVESCVGDDGDADGVPDACDTCPAVPNPEQTDTDGDGDGDACDADDDNDLVDDDADCAPLSRGISTPPGPIGNSVRLTKDIGAVIAWSAGAQSPTANVYRGVFSAGAPWSYDLECFAAELPLLLTEDIEDPPPGTGFYYLITTRNVCGESIAHLDGDGMPIVAMPPCPSQQRDIDGDQVPDVEDNCPLLPNASQSDDDYDFVGNPCDNCADVSNPDQVDSDFDAQGDVCDDCTDTDGDGWGNPSFSPVACGVDNCPDISNAGQQDADNDGAGDVCDVCPGDPFNDADADGVCGDEDNCPAQANHTQADADGDGQGDECDDCTDTDGDGLGDPGYSNPFCGTDNCPTETNPGQEDGDGDGAGDVCDPCPADPDNDLDLDGVCGDVDNCPNLYNIDQADADADGLGDLCDPCRNNPDLACESCPRGTDPDSDGICRDEIVYVEEGTSVRWLANETDPSLGLLWTDEGFDDSGWAQGVYGIGYDGDGLADRLIGTTAPPNARSIYTRVEINVADPQAINWVRVGADYDDGWAMWLNGVEIFRSPEMPAGAPDWDTTPTGHESSNGAVPNYDPRVDISSTAIPAFQPGLNVVAVGVWNTSTASSDLLVVPWLSTNGANNDNCPNDPNPDQADTDGDGIGDACDPS